jgi:hypothetical protein
MLIPLGKIALMETEKSDRTGACGRAAMREVQVRRMLDFTSVWQPNTDYSLNVIVRPQTATGYLYFCTQRGQSGATEPSWSAVGNITNDGNAKWLNIGLATATAPFVIDPLGVTNGLTANLGGTNNLLRINYLSTPYVYQVDPIFRWSDELTFDTPTDATARPRVLASDGAGTVAPWPWLPTDPIPTWGPPVEFANAGNFSWFLTVTPALSEATFAVPNKRLYSVAVVVCNKRILTQTGTQPDGERDLASIGTITCDTSPSYGGVGISIVGNAMDGPPPLKNNEWILLYSTNAAGTIIIQADWYRVVHAGYIPDATDPTDPTLGATRVMLVGPDWNGGTGTATDPVHAIVVQGVTGVYTTTIQLDNDLIWSR